VLCCCVNGCGGDSGGHSIAHEGEGAGAKKVQNQATGAQFWQTMCRDGCIWVEGGWLGWGDIFLRGWEVGGIVHEAARGPRPKTKKLEKPSLVFGCLRAADAIEGCCVVTAPLPREN
jgi:hypothetical protein